jgi:hypothetical protein
MTKATGISLVETRLQGGVWEGVLTGVKGNPPAVEAMQSDRVIEGVEVTAIPGKADRFAVRVPIPGWALNEGVQTFLIRVGDEVLATFTLIAGTPMDEDLRSEIGLLRAELELLKRAFRRHCAETGG